MNTILLQLVSILSNILAIIYICLRLNSQNENNNNNISSLPFIKNDGCNLALNVILIIYCISTLVFVLKLFIYHLEILMKNLTTYQDIKLSSQGLNYHQLPYNIFTRLEKQINFPSQLKFMFYLFKKKILFRANKKYFIPFEFYKLETNENFEFLQTAVVGNNNLNQKNGNIYNSVPSSAFSNEIFDVRINANMKNKILAEAYYHKELKDHQENNLNLNFPCNQIKEHITNHYNHNTNSYSYSNTDNQIKNNGQISAIQKNMILNTVSNSLSNSNSKGKNIGFLDYNEEDIHNINSLSNFNQNNQNIFKDNSNLQQKINKSLNNISNKNINKRMNKYLINNKIISVDNLFKEQLPLGKYRRNIGPLSSNNQQKFSYHFSSNTQESNIQLGEIHLSEREKNNLNHLIKDIEYPVHANKLHNELVNGDNIVKPLKKKNIENINSQNTLSAARSE